ncbi:hypothetical protein TSUD_288440 [Trifolium subterraneum]|uniref:Endonuclease/exonuclease/phosphatase domain-containing protein n=1 Tax=Trifolium subterraneum TaxID=3900 RepID=A0A2Z6NG06_TRISU|nr:hypothetical protein TSUD_288440 [Trifolium subterraneum]
MSRLDRMLVSGNWMEEWGPVSLWGLKRDVSDHCPLILKYDGHDWSPKTFRFNNHWLDNKTFAKRVEEEWGSLKGALKKWNKIEALTCEIEVLDLKGESKGLLEEEVLERKTKCEHLWLLLKSKDRLEFQKSHSRLLKEGDANSGFFHACVKSRKRSNSIVAYFGWC